MDNNQPMNLLETIFMVLGISVSLTQIETITGIVLMCAQAALIIARLIIAIVQRKKNNDLNGAIEDMKDAQQELATLAEKEKAKQEEIARKNEERQRKEQERIARENAKIDAEIAKLQKKKILGPRVRKED